MSHGPWLKRSWKWLPKMKLVAKKRKIIEELLQITDLEHELGHKWWYEIYLRAL